MNRLHFQDLDYAPVADFGLLMAAYDSARGPQPPTIRSSAARSGRSSSSGVTVSPLRT
jgi:hypothetical protein